MDTPSHTGLYKYIRENYDRNMLSACRRSVTTAVKLSRQKQHLVFNLRCKRYGLVPNSLRVRPLVRNHQGYHVAARASRQFLCARITQTARRIRELETDLYFQQRQLDYALRPEHCSSLNNLREQAEAQMLSRSRDSHKNKFDRLLLKQRAPRGASHSLTKKWVVNLSSRTLSDHKKLFRMFAALTRFLLSWFKSQSMHVQWNTSTSPPPPFLSPMAYVKVVYYHPSFVPSTWMNSWSA